MVCPTSATPAQFPQWLERLHRLARHQGWRHLVVVEGSEPWRAACLEQVHWFAGDGLWIGDPPPAACPAGLTGITQAQARQWLGRDLQWVVWDLWSGLRPDALGTVSGTLRGGGCLLWLLPPPGVAGEPPFLARARRLLADEGTIWHWKEGSPAPGLPTPPAGPAWQPPDGSPTAPQQRILGAIEAQLAGRQAAHLVLTAGRGRGKSAVLGMAAAKLAGKGFRLLVTAPRPRALDSFWHHAQAQGDGAPPAEFMPVDRLLQERPAADLLMVDEAAGVPAPLLEALLGQYPRIVFASTVHGYEGTGRGFDLRFREALHRQAPGWHSLKLEDPVRWRSGDPLEAFMDRLLLLDAGPRPDLQADEPIRLRPVSGQELARNEPWLAQAFGLLVQAHYQTSPDDLRHWLDDPDTLCWIALQGSETVLGVLWVQREGPLSASLAEAVWRGERRPPGAVLPQLLAFQGGDPAAARLRYGRVIRIAVHPGWRRRGLGHRLLAAARDAGGEAGLDVLGTSFGATDDLIPFWHRAGWRALRLGLKADAASGAHSLVMALPLTPAGEVLCQSQRQRFAEHWPLLLASALRRLDPALVPLLDRDWLTPIELDEADRRELAAFTQGHRGLEVTRLALQHLEAALPPGLRPNLHEDGLWTRAVRQCWDWEALRAAGQVAGRRDGVGRLRSLAREVFKEGIFPSSD